MQRNKNKIGLKNPHWRSLALAEKASLGCLHSILTPTTGPLRPVADLEAFVPVQAGGAREDHPVAVVALAEAAAVAWHARRLAWVAGLLAGL